MPDITAADLFAVQANITSAVRHEVGLARDEFREQLGVVRETQREQDVRLDGHARELARLEERTKIGRSLFASLSPKQKAALWSSLIPLAGVLVDGARHIGTLLVAVSKGIHP